MTDKQFKIFHCFLFFDVGPWIKIFTKALIVARTFVANYFSSTATCAQGTPLFARTLFPPTFGALLPLKTHFVKKNASVLLNKVNLRCLLWTPYFPLVTMHSELKSFLK